MPRFDVYGHYQVEVDRVDDRWVVYRLGEGTRRVLHEVVVPRDLPEDELARALDDQLHELARPGSTIRRVG